MTNTFVFKFLTIVLLIGNTLQVSVAAAAESSSKSGLRGQQLRSQKRQLQSRSDDANKATVGQGIGRFFSETGSKVVGFWEDVFGTADGEENEDEPNGFADSSTPTTPPTEALTMMVTFETSFEDTVDSTQGEGQKA